MVRMKDEGGGMKKKPTEAIFRNTCGDLYSKVYYVSFLG